jgi:hypothetical protein
LCFSNQLLVAEIPVSSKNTTIFIISLLSHYNKYERQNVYVSLLSELDSNLIIQQQLFVLWSQLRTNSSQQAGSAAAGGISQLGSYFSSWFSLSSTETTTTAPNVGPVLLSLYDWVHCNKVYRRLLCSNRLSGGADPYPVQTPACPIVLEEFLQFLGGVLDTVQSLQQACSSKIGLIALLCLVEDPESCAALHDTANGCYLPSPLVKVISHLLSKFFLELSN